MTPGVDMAELLRRGRMQGAMGPQQGAMGGGPPQQAPPMVAPPQSQPPVDLAPPPNQGFDPQALMAALGGGPERQAYQEHLGQRPEREAHDPGIGKMLLAILAGAMAGPQQGFNIGQGMRTGPYDRAMGEWEQEGTALGQQASMADRDTKDKLNFGFRQQGLENQRSRWEVEDKRNAESRAFQEEQAKLRGQRWDARQDATTANREEIRKRSDRTFDALQAERNKADGPSFGSAANTTRGGIQAYREMIRVNPEYEKWFDLDKTGAWPKSYKELKGINYSWNPLEPDIDLDRTEYDAFIKEFERLTQEKANPIRGGGTVGADEFLREGQ